MVKLIEKYKIKMNWKDKVKGYLCFMRKLQEKVVPIDVYQKKALVLGILACIVIA